MKFHPVANIFPLLQDEEYKQLKDDIAKNGLLEPIWLHPDGQILDGRNRWRACVDTGTEARTRLYEGDLSTPALVSFVVSLNLKRRHLDSSQLAVVALEIEKVLAEAARERQEVGNNQYGVKEIIPEASKGQARDQAAAIVGTNGRYVQDAKNVQKNAPELIPEVAAGTITLPESKKLARLPEEQRERAINKKKAGEAKTIKEAICQVRTEDAAKRTERQEAQQVEGCKVIIGDARRMELDQFEQYGVIIADPPWSYQQFSERKNGAAKSAYDLMTIEDLRGMPVSRLAAKNSILFLWGTWPKLPEAIELIKTWGFDYVTGFPWIKTDRSKQPDYGVGFWVRGCSEYVLIGRRGDVSPPRLNGFLGLIGEGMEHSRKPDSVHQIAKELPGPYLELFARRPKIGWTVFGNDPALAQKIFA